MPSAVPIHPVDSFCVKGTESSSHTLVGCALREIFVRGYPKLEYFITFYVTLFL